MKKNAEQPLVFFVGAGSGAKDLITLRGKELLEKADVVVWAGSLVNPELLSFCRADARIFDSSRLTLEETTEILSDAAERGELCVRLHTGDPSIFGAIREQMEALDARGISYDIVPGVSSFCAAAAALKAELTVPGVSQTVIITRLSGKTPVPKKESLPELSKHKASTVLFLSAAQIPRIVEELLAGGAFTAETPAAVAYKASWPEQKIIRGTLGTIAALAEESGITKTALFFAGDFLGGEHGKSRLYDKSFSTEFRKAKEP